jgi:rRNA-processing protein EBP2
LSPSPERQDGTSAPTGATEADDLFDVAVDNELKTAGNSRKRSAGDRDGPPNHKRQKKDAKFGFGGKKRFAKSGDAKSSGDLSGFSAKRMKGAFSESRAGGGQKGPAKPRLGKSRRQGGNNKR